MPRSREEIEKLIKRCDTLESQNSNWRIYHEDLASFCLPRKAWQTTIRNIGDRLKLNSLFDSTAIRSLKICASGFHSHLTNLATKWFGLQTRNPALMKNREVVLWFKEVEDIIFSVLNSSNFDQSIQEFYMDNGCFGTGPILIQSDPIDKVRFTNCPLSQVNFEEDARRRVNRFYWTRPMTVQQAFDLWGSRTGTAVMEKIKERPQDIINVVNYVGPREKRDATKDDSVNMPWESLWIEKSKKHLIGESGYAEFPYVVGRFYKDSLDTFGFSPAMDALAEIKLINAQQRTMLRAAMKAADPPLIMPNKGFILPLNLNPSALNYRKSASTTKDDLQQVPTSGNIPITIEIIESVKRAIQEAFFVMAFRALSDVTKEMTVPEVNRRIAESMVLLGPVVGGFMDDVLDPIIFRVFNILQRAGELPEPPAVLEGAEMDVVYLSPLARAQRESEIYAIESFLVDVQAIAQVKPAALDKINEDATVDAIAHIKGINPEILRDDVEVRAIREQRAQAEQAQLQAAQLAQGAETVQAGAAAYKALRDAEKP